MATTPTNKPIPSEDPRDLKFNAGKVDEFVTSMGWTYTDRFGGEHYTIEGLRYLAQQSIAEFGYITMDSFQDGATLTLPNQVLRDVSTGEYYRWDGTLPKEVPVNSTPASTGGVGLGAWLSVGDATVRADLLDFKSSLISTGDGYGDELIGVKLNYNGSKGRTQHDKNTDIISIYDFDVKANGVDDDTSSLQIACNAAYDKGKTLLLYGNILIKNNINIKCKLLTYGDVTISAPDHNSSSPAVSLFFPFGGGVSNITVNNISLKAFKYTTEIGNIKNSFGVIFQFIKGYNFTIDIGDNARTVRNVLIDNIYGFLTLERSASLITLTNVSDYIVSNIGCQDYSFAVSVNPTRSFCNTNGKIINLKSSSAAGISLQGTSKNRISKLLIENCTLEQAARSSSSTGSPAIILAYCHQISLKGVRATSNGKPIYMENCTSISINEAYAYCGRNVINNYPIQINASKNIDIINSTALHSEWGSGSSVIAVTGQTSNKSKKIRITNCNLKSPRTCISVSNTDGVSITKNRMEAVASAAFNSEPVVYIANTVNGGFVLENETFAPSGVNALLNSSTTVTTTTANQNNVTTFSRVVTEIARGVSDPSLNNAISYIYNFSVTDVTQIISVVADTTSGVAATKTMTQFMSGLTGAMLAWNASGFQRETNKMPDIVSNGIIRDIQGPEFFPFPSGIVIDIHNKLTCRDFKLTQDDGESTTNSTAKFIATAALSEDAYHAAFFLPPLVVDNAIYDIHATDIIHEEDYSITLSGRMAIGQKNDGTYVIVAVDGATGINGCTIKQMAQKMLSLGCVNAFNLDGGGSATLWYNGSVVNSPSGGSERAIPHIMYV